MPQNKKIFPLITLCLLAIVTGCLVSIAFKTFSDSIPSAESPANQKNQALIGYINKLEQEISDLEKAIISTRDGMQAMQKEQSEDSLALKGLQTELSKLNFAAKFTEVSGPGLTIVLDDNASGAELAQKTNPGSYFPENYIIHDRNLLYIIRDLSSVSEAISVNNVRLGDNYNIRCVGTVIMINSSRMAPPYEIKVIGDPDLLEATLTASGEYIYLKSINMPVKYSKHEQLTLLAYTGSQSITDVTALVDDDADADI